MDGSSRDGVGLTTHSAGTLSLSATAALAGDGKSPERHKGSIDDRKPLSLQDRLVSFSTARENFELQAQQQKEQAQQQNQHYARSPSIGTGQRPSTGLHKAYSMRERKSAPVVSRMVAKPFASPAVPSLSRSSTFTETPGSSPRAIVRRASDDGLTRQSTEEAHAFEFKTAIPPLSTEANPLSADGTSHVRAAITIDSSGKDVTEAVPSAGDTNASGSNNEIERLRRELAEARHEIASKDAAIASLTEKVSSAGADGETIRSLKEEIASLSARVEAEKADKNRLAGELSVVRVELEAGAKTIVSMETELIEVGEACSRGYAEVDVLRRDMLQKEAELENVLEEVKILRLEAAIIRRSNFDEVSAIRAAHAQEVNDLCSQIDFLRDHLEETEAELNEQMRANDELRALFEQENVDGDDGGDGEGDADGASEVGGGDASGNGEGSLEDVEERSVDTAGDEAEHLEARGDGRALDGDAVATAEIPDPSPLPSVSCPSDDSAGALAVEGEADAVSSSLAAAPAQPQETALDLSDIREEAEVEEEEDDAIAAAVAKSLAYDSDGAEESQLAVAAVSRVADARDLHTADASISAGVGESVPSENVDGVVVGAAKSTVADTAVHAPAARRTSVDAVVRSRAERSGSLAGSSASADSTEVRRGSVTSRHNHSLSDASRASGGSLKKPPLTTRVSSSNMRVIPFEIAIKDDVLASLSNVDMHPDRKRAVILAPWKRGVKASDIIGTRADADNTRAPAIMRGSAITVGGGGSAGNAGDSTTPSVAGAAQPSRAMSVPPPVVVTASAPDGETVVVTAPGDDAISPGEELLVRPVRSLSLHSLHLTSGGSDSGDESDGNRSQKPSRRPSASASAAVPPPMSPNHGQLLSARLIPDGVRIEVHKEGFLTKLGGKNKNWKRRWFVLDNEKLAYYKKQRHSEQNVDPAGVLDFTFGLCTVHSALATKKSNAFEVVTPLRTYTIFADTSEAASEWITAIQKAIEESRLIMGRKGRAIKGYLTKQGANYKTWRKRWFVLDEENGEVVYYRSNKEKERLGAISLRSSATSVPITPGHISFVPYFKYSRHNVLEVVTEARVFLLQAETPSDGRRWVHALKRCARRLDGSARAAESGRTSDSSDNDSEN
eukprot:Opistho-2@88761